MRQPLLATFGQGPRLGRVAGIPLILDWSVIPFAFLLVLSFGASVSGNPFLALLAGVLIAGAILGSILAHELGHALVAARFGIRTELITLHLFGGLARLRSEPRTPHHELLVAAAGPAVSLGLALLLAGLAWFLPGPFLAYVLGTAATVNLVLGLFNLLPGFPLDGGRILRAVLWHRLRSRFRATLAAARAGTVIGWLLIGAAAVLFFGGRVFDGLMLGMVGFLILQAARAEALSAGVMGYHDPPPPSRRSALPGETVIIVTRPSRWTR